MSTDKEKKHVLSKYETRAEVLEAKGYRRNPFYLASKALSDWALMYEVDFRDKKVLNVGCSEPIDELFFGYQCREWTALDFSPSTIKLSRLIIDKNLSPDIAKRITFVQGDATSMSFSDNSFDIVICFSVIEHIPGRQNRQKAVEEMARVAKPGGHVIITVPNKKSTFYFANRRNQKNDTSDYGFCHLYTRKELEKSLGLAGMTPLKFNADNQLKTSFLIRPIRYMSRIVQNFGERMGYIAEKPIK